MTYLNNLYRVRNAVFSSFSIFIRILLKVIIISNLINIRAAHSLIIVSLIRDKIFRFFIIKIFNIR